MRRNEPPPPMRLKPAPPPMPPPVFTDKLISKDAAIAAIEAEAAKMYSLSEFERGIVALRMVRAIDRL